MRSPHLKRNTAERSPTMSPRKTNSNANNGQPQHAKIIMNQQHLQHVEQQQIKSRQFVSNSVHVAAPDDCSGGGTSDEDSDNINVDKLKTIRNKAAQR